ncbi:DUF1828 domain-containing protein [Candidatus Poriferisodalis sp.]|uniref:DUF1828 domain-containing protein n=1 Tax=Candidatus Poriferisodalis sp. TaxID=3101277 RepID=UPI003B022EE5
MLEEIVRTGVPALFECSDAPNGNLQVHTPLIQPDGSVIDVYIRERDDKILVTDFGDAIGWLKMNSMSGKLSWNQKRLIADVCQTLDVEKPNGQLEVWCNEQSELPDAIERVAQATLRISDIYFTFRTRSFHSIANEVDAWLRERRFSCTRRAKYRGNSGRNWTVDYVVEAGSTNFCLMFLLSTNTRDAASRISDRVFTGCSDLHNASGRKGTGVRGATILSLFDDTVDVWRTPDYELLAQVSRIAKWSHSDELEQILTTG